MTDHDGTGRMLMVGGAGAAPAGIDVAVMALEEAKARGLRVHLTNHEAELAETAAACAMADAVSAVDFEDVPESVAWVRDRVAGGERFDLVFTYREFAVVAAAEIAAALGVAGNPPEAVRRARTKDATRIRLTEAGFAQPRWRVCADAGAATAFLRESSGPWVVKPRDGAGSEGVSLVSDPTRLDAAVSLLGGGPGPFLVEEFVDGAEYSADGVFLDGRPEILAVTVKDKTPPPYFVEIGHTLPAPLPEPTRLEIVDTVSRALVALGLRFGQFHAEFWLTAHGIVLGEVNVRVGGGYIHRMLPHAIPGLELFGLVYDDALGRLDRRPALECVRAAASRYFVPPPGRLVAVEGWAELAAHPAVLCADLTVRPGDLINPMRSSDDKVGPVVVGADTAEQARGLAAELAASVRFVVEPES